MKEKILNSNELLMLCKLNVICFVLFKENSKNVRNGVLLMVDASRGQETIYYILQ